jgi:hypothetical protein
MFTTGACATANSRLDNLTLSAGALSPSYVGNLSPPFASTLQTYSALVTVTPIVIVATLADSAAAVKVNGMAAVSGSPSAPIALNPGNNVITVVVTAQDGVTTRTYTINVLFFVRGRWPR